jgi:branched-chain amino acid transport system ATP-binding protein
MILLETQHLGVRFGGLLALDNFNLALPEHGLYGLIGPNGAGKTTVFNLLAAFSSPPRGP